MVRQLRLSTVVTLLFFVASGVAHGFPSSDHTPAPATQSVIPSGTPTLGVNWRDQEVKAAFFSKGRIRLRTDLANDYGLFFSYGSACVGCLRIGITSGGTDYNTDVEDSPATCIANWPSGAGHTFTFGVKGFNVYLLIDGAQAIDTCEMTALNPTGAVNYMEYRQPGQNVAAPSIKVEVGSGGAATFNYFQNVPPFQRWQ